MKTLLINFLCPLFFSVLFLSACDPNEPGDDVDKFEDVDDSLNLTVIDFDTHRPVADVEVFITNAAFGNLTIYLSGLTSLGKSDKCGRVSGPAPRERARYTVHGEQDTTHFVLLFKGAGYGEFYEVVEIGEANNEMVAKRPFVYNLATTVNPAVPSVQLDWSIRRSIMRYYDDKGSTYIVSANKFHIWRQTVNSTVGGYKEIFSEDFEDGHNGTFTDLTVHPDSTYRYQLFPYNDISMSAGLTEATIDMKTSTGTTVWWPRPNTCN